VFDSMQRMRHLPFFTELASLEEHDPSWRAVSGGLVFLRLVDAWVEEGASVVAADGWGVHSVAACLEEMPVGMPARAILMSALDALTAARCGDMHAVAPRLMAYARSLDLDAKWALAADVYETVIAYTDPTRDADDAFSAHMRLSYCRRQLGELDAAEDIALQAGRIALAAGDLVGSLYARIAEAKVSSARGNYPRAEVMLDDTIRCAEDANLQQFRASAIQERAAVAHLKGDYEYAIRLGYEALDKLADERQRDRMLGDIAGAFYKLGVRSAARDAYTLLSVTAQEQFVRWTSTINLMEIAAADGSLPLFERHRRHLDAAALPPVLHAQFLLHAGEGLSRLGDPEGARRNLTEAMAFAAKYGYNRLVFDAEEQLKGLSDIPRITPAETPMPEGLATIASEIRHRQAGITALR
jgi:tetratricopeptide (TPR) repeat protein